MPGPQELILILLLCLVVFGASRLPQIGEGLGKAIRGFKRGISTNDDIDVTPKQVGDSSSVKSMPDDDVQEAQKVPAKGTQEDS